MALAREIVKGNKPAHPRNSYRDRHPYSFFVEQMFKPVICFLAKKKILKKTRGFYPAPLKALEVIKKNYSLFDFHRKRDFVFRKPWQKKLEIEKQAFMNLFQTPESQNLIRLWVIGDRAKKIKTSPKSSDFEGQKFRFERNKTKPAGNNFLNMKNKEASPKEIERVGIIGAGVMGSSIAYLFANRGFKVRLVDNKAQSLCSALKQAKTLMEKEKKRGRMDSYQFKQKMNNLSVSDNFWGFSTLDLVIEALPEDKKLKAKLIAQISKKMHSHSLFASNSSSLSISELARHSLYPKNFFGLHFFNPAHKMPLVEIGFTEEQRARLLSPVQSLVRKIGKVPLFVEDSPGFVVNRLLARYLNEALLMFEQGCEIESIDSCYRKFGMPLGPFELMDKIGLDICMEVISCLIEAGIPFKTAEWTANLVEVLGKGEKSGAGFYIYGKKKGLLNKKTGNLKRVSVQASLSDKEILKRGIYGMVYEGKNLLENNIVQSEEDIDFALVLAIGFPAFLGGPMSYARRQGSSAN